MLEVSNPSNVLNISGEFQRDMPIQARRNWSVTSSRSHRACTRVRSTTAAAAWCISATAPSTSPTSSSSKARSPRTIRDAQITYVAMGADMVSDTQVKTGGVDASRPDGRRPQHQRHHQERRQHVHGIRPATPTSRMAGTATTSTTARRARHASRATSAAVGTPTTAIIRQFDVGIGGPITARQGLVLRRAPAGGPRSGHQPHRGGSAAPQRSGAGRRALQQHHREHAAVREGDDPGAASTRSRRSCSRIGCKATGDREYNYTRAFVFSTGGGLYGGKVTSVWGDKMTSDACSRRTTTRAARTPSTFEDFVGAGPTITIHRAASLTGGRLIGSGRLVSGSNFDDGNGQATDAVARRRRKSRCAPT